LDAKLIVLPENWAFMGQHEDEKLEYAEDFGVGHIQTFMQKAAQTHGIYLVGGAIPLKTGFDHRVFNSCLVYDPEGETIARYDKIHLFDVTLDEEARESYKESNTIAHGTHPVVADTLYGKIGLSICYDLRFPELYQKLSPQDLFALTVPSAFTETTGKAHWETLLKARAIENQCYVIAPNQGGAHSKSRRSWGHSMIISPWGDILAKIETGNGVITANLDLNKLISLRKNFPTLNHKRIKD
jgi:nitrilase